MFNITNEEKSYSIQKIKRYKDLIDKEEKKLTEQVLAVGVLSTAALYAAALTPTFDFNTYPIFTFISLSLTFVSTWTGAYVLKELIQSISRKTMFEGKIEDINYELGKLENNESRGMKK